MSDRKRPDEIATLWDVLVDVQSIEAFADEREAPRVQAWVHVLSAVHARTVRDEANTISAFHAHNLRGLAAILKLPPTVEWGAVKDAVRSLLASANASERVLFEIADKAANAANAAEKARP